MKKIPLTKGQFALVDDEDYEYLNQFKWCAAKRRKLFTAVRRLPKQEGFKNILMHTFIMGTSPIDHINGNPLDNRRCNLRPCTVTENACNRGPNAHNKSGLKGVSYSSESYRAKRWTMEVRKGTTRIRKRFFTKEEAHEAYKKAAIELHGEFAKWE